MEEAVIESSFQGKLEEDSRLNRVRQDQERKMLNQNQRAYNSVQDQESVRSLQETLMRINNNWNEMRDVFDSEVRWRIEENSEEERKDVLVRGNKFMGNDRVFRKGYGKSKKAEPN